jgi:hypothetical protein
MFAMSSHAYVAARLFRGLLAVVVCVLFVTFPAAAGAKAPARVTFWVSPVGDDHADGDRSHPFRTLVRARDAVRAAQRRSGHSQYFILLLDGTYRLSHTLVLDWRDSGRAGADVVWSAARGAHPVISGAIRVRGWRLHDRRRQIFEASVPSGLVTRQLYVSGWRAVRARGRSYPRGFVRTASGFLAPDYSMDSWRNPSHIEAVTLVQWKMMRCPVASIRGRAIVMQQPCWRNVNVFPYEWSFQTLAWLENAYELLNTPGEWYLDTAAGRLYYIPRAGERLAGADVELPVIQQLIDVRGTLRRPVTHVRFQGLTFAYGTWLPPSGPNGYAADQSGFHLVGYGHQRNVIGHDPNTVRTPGNVRLAYARDIEFKHDNFLHLGGVGLDFNTGSQHDAIIGNRFNDISSAAIQLGGVSAVDHHPTRPGQVTLDNVISNNLVTNVAREYNDAAGIYVGFTTRSLVEHNDISAVPWSGIAIGWGWGLLDPSGFLGLPGAVKGQWGTYRTPTTSRGNRISDNHIQGFLNILWDGGAIYTLGQQGTSARDGELIVGNVASDKRRLAGGNTFYTDGGSRYVTLKQNVSLNNNPGVTDFGPCGLPDSLALCGVVVPYGSDRGGCRPYGDLTYQQNYWSFPTPFFSICPHPPYPVNVIDIDNRAISGPHEVPRSILDAAGLEPAYRATVGAGP